MRLPGLRSSLLFFLLPVTYADSSGNAGLYPPGLQPLITRANVLLSSGQFSEAAKVYSEAIGQCFGADFVWIGAVEGMDFVATSGSFFWGGLSGCRVKMGSQLVRLQ